MLGAYVILMNIKQKSGEIVVKVFHMWSGHYTSRAKLYHFPKPKPVLLQIYLEDKPLHLSLKETINNVEVK